MKKVYLLIFIIILVILLDINNIKSSAIKNDGIEIQDIVLTPEELKAIAYDLEYIANKSILNQLELKIKEYKYTSNLNDLKNIMITFNKVSKRYKDQAKSILKLYGIYDNLIKYNNDINANIID